MEDRTVPFKKEGPGDISGTAYIDRTPPVATWQEGDDDATPKDVDTLIGSALGRRVRIIDVHHHGRGRYGGIITYLDTADFQEP